MDLDLDSNVIWSNLFPELISKIIINMGKDGRCLSTDNRSRFDKQVKKLAFDRRDIHLNFHIDNLLASCHFVTSINIRCCKITDINALAVCTALTHLDIKLCTSIVDIGALATCTALVHLDINFCDSIVDIGVLANCTALSSINMRECKGILDIGALASCTALTCIDIEGCGIVNIDVLTVCRALICIYTSVEDCSVLLSGKIRRRQYM
jgi:hypothetical protein